MRTLVLLLLLMSGGALVADEADCFVCRLRLGGTIYLLTDKVTGKKVQLHRDCLNGTSCAVCAIPAGSGALVLEDGRAYCRRDKGTVITEKTEAKRICSTVLEDLNRLFSQYTSFPSRYELEIVDRAYMDVLFKTPGFQSQCGNVYGIMRREEGRTDFEVKILYGVPSGTLQSTMAHELTHCWVFDNIAPSRQLHPFAHEGFCELVAYKLMIEKAQANEVTQIKANSYTRGQVHLFIEADRQYGFNTVLDWIRYGVDPLLNADDLDRIRMIEIPKKSQKKEASAPFVAAGPAPAPADKLLLKGISGSGNRRLALINDKTLGVGESAIVKLAQTNLHIKLLEIGPDRVKVSRDGVEEELGLTSK